MKYARIVHLIVLLIVVASMSPVAAQEELPPGRDMLFEQEIYDRLALIAPAAVAVFQDATRALDTQDFETARRGYEQVLQLAPGFPDAARRLSGIELEFGNVQAALEYAHQAYEADPSPYNQLAVARALVVEADPAKALIALKHAQAVVRALPEDLGANLILLWAGIGSESETAIRQASNTLVRLAPDLPLGHYFAGLLMAQDGSWEEAERALRLSQTLGMPSEVVQEALNSGITRQARLHRLRRWGGYVIVGWLVGLAGLFLTGVSLSYFTLAAIRHIRPTDQLRGNFLERSIRMIYRVIITVTSGYFYLSIPIVVALVLIIAGIYAYIVILSGDLRLLIQLPVAVGVALITVFVVITSCLIRARDNAPRGRQVSKEEAPRLWALVEEVAARVGTRPVDVVYVKALPGIAVMERGPLRQQLRGAGQRCLILGLGSLPGMTQAQFRAILAHEYGHFCGRDTAGGRLARQVQYSIHNMAEQIMSSGQAHWYNPVWLFVNGYYRIFLRITLGASRFQEVLADRYAVRAYGVRNFITALEYIVRQDTLFQVQAAQEIIEAHEQKRICRNLYTLPPLEPSLQREFELMLEELLARPTSPYDSHPAVEERIALLQGSDDGMLAEEDEAWAWDLLPDAEVWQEQTGAPISTNLQTFSSGAAALQHLKRAARSSYQSRSIAADSLVLSFRDRLLRLWVRIGARKHLWMILLSVLVMIGIGLLNMTLQGEILGVYIIVVSILLLVSVLFLLTPRTAFIPCAVLCPMIEVKHNTIYLTGKLSHSYISKQEEWDRLIATGYDPAFSPDRTEFFTDMPFDLMVKKEERLIMALRRETIGASTRIIAPSAQAAATNSEYWGVKLTPEDFSQIRSGILVGRWDRPALCFTHRLHHKPGQVYVAFSNFTIYEQALSFLQCGGVPVAPPVGLVLPETEDASTVNDQTMAVFSWYAQD